MNKNLYEMIFKRKSFHIFKDTENIKAEEISKIEEKFETGQKKNQSMILCMKILLHDVEYIGENTQRKLVVNS